MIGMRVRHHHVVDDEHALPEQKGHDHALTRIPVTGRITAAVNQPDATSGRKQGGAISLPDWQKMRGQFGRSVATHPRLGDRQEQGRGDRDRCHPPTHAGCEQREKQPRQPRFDRAK